MKKTSRACRTGWVGWVLALASFFGFRRLSFRSAAVTPVTPVTSKAAKTTFYTSQAGNDVSSFIFSFFLGERGTFVEFGCADGKTNSNSYIFEKELGWKGLCIEPNYQNFLKAQMTRENVFHGLVTPDFREYVYAEMSGDCDQLSGILEFYSQAFLDLYADCKKRGLVKEMKMKGAPLEYYLKEANFESVDWISVDCEGCESEFLMSFDFSKFKVRVVNYEPNTAARRFTDEIGAALARHKLIYNQTLQDKVFTRVDDDWFAGSRTGC
jgi:hypothetical protein